METSPGSRMKELVDLLNRASRAYYAQDEEIMSNFEYDRLYDELVALEKSTGVVLADSPTVNVGYEAVDELPKERHEKPMLSLDKTKSREELQSWLNGHTGLLSWKLDGLTVVLTYENGQLAKAVTRGNGEVGEVITANARVFKNIPLSIPFKGRLILRGEAIIRYSDFEKINEELEEEAVREGNPQDVRYKNPRNLCSGSVRQLNNAVTAKRQVRFYAFSLVSAEGEDFGNSRLAQFRFLAEQGFDVVEHYLVEEDTIQERISYFEKKIAHDESRGGKIYDIPSDGLVLLLEDIAYGESLGSTAKFPRNAIAFKWQDETRETILREVEWSASRTGLINPVAIFDPVELEGTTVRRASVHNVSIVRQLKLGIGDTIRVYKANMIIPQIAENLTGSDTLQIPEACPVCGGKTQIRAENDAEALFCMNPSCPAKKLKAFSLFVSRSAMNIEGLSEMTLEKFIAEGFIHEFADIYRLSDHKEKIVQLEGFGEKSYEKLSEAVEASRRTTPRRLLTAVGIPGIGASGARLICAHFDNDLEKICQASPEELGEIDGIGPVLAKNFSEWFTEEENADMFRRLVSEVEITRQDPSTTSLTAQAGGAEDGNAEASAAAAAISGKTFVVTGSVYHFANRNELKEYIENFGGTVAGSVSKKTDYLINNDAASASSKNKKAAALGIPVITEEEFMAMCKARP